MWILIAIISAGLVLFFLFKPTPQKKYPVITAEMFENPNEIITLALAKKYYRQVMLKTGHLDKEEIGYHTDLFAEGLKEELESLKKSIDEYKANIAEIEPKLKELRKKLKTCTDADEKDEIKAEIEGFLDEINDYQSTVEDETKSLTALKADKKQYLIDALNQELSH